MRLGFPDAGNDPPDTMTRQAYDLNTEGFGPGTNGPLVIAAELPGPEARAGIDSLAQRLRDEDGVAMVTDPQVNQGRESQLGEHDAHRGLYTGTGRHVLGAASPA